jgi:RNAse (barnase) inhibitor barstar
MGQACGTAPQLAPARRFTRQTTAELASHQLDQGDWPDGPVSGKAVSQDLAHVTTAFNIHPMRYQIDGSRFATLEEFYEEVSQVLIPGESWGRNLDAFNDILRGGFETPPKGFTIEWKNHALSKERLGYDETVRQLEIRLGSCHPSNRDNVSRELERARAHQGPTVFNWLIDIIGIHCRGGREEDDGVELLLD